MPLLAQTTTTDSLLNVLLDELVRAKAPLVDLLNKGAGEAAIQRAEKQLGFKIPTEAVALFKWRNGTAFSKELPWGAQWLFPLGTPVSLERALKAHKRSSRHKTNRGRMFLLIFENFGGELYYLDCHVSSGTYGRIWRYSLTNLEDGRPAWYTIYDSLPAFLETMIQCYRQQAYTFKEGKLRTLQTNFKREVEIARKLNPNAEHWKYMSEVAANLPEGEH
jgi:hypothetical protein